MEDKNFRRRLLILSGCQDPVHLPAGYKRLEYLALANPKDNIVNHSLIIRFKFSYEDPDKDITYNYHKVYQDFELKFGKKSNTDKSSFNYEYYNVQTAASLEIKTDNIFKTISSFVIKPNSLSRVYNTANIKSDPEEFSFDYDSNLNATVFSHYDSYPKEGTSRNENKSLIKINNKEVAYYSSSAIDQSTNFGMEITLSPEFKFYYLKYFNKVTLEEDYIVPCYKESTKEYGVIVPAIIEDASERTMYNKYELGNFYPITAGDTIVAPFINGGGNS